MELTKEDLKQEELKLSETVKEIDYQIENAGSDIFKDKDNLKEFQEYIWGNTTDFDEEELNQLLYDNDLKVQVLDNKTLKFRKLKKIRNNPYFGSFVFNDEKIYVGITSVKRDLDYLVCDWRAPISSMFYDFGVGPAEYKTPDGKEKGKITQKRQYTIQDAKLKHVFDTNLNIDDDMLQDVLAESSSDKMKNIVNTIQKEQNQVIRNNTNTNIVVQGIAGSGKTSVALHRIAFLLYKLEYLSSGNVLIFSPNNVFTEYISNVLPDLGEDNTMQTTFHSFARTFIPEYEGVEPYSTFVERYYKGYKQDNDLITFKLSDKMKTLIENFVKVFSKAAEFTEDFDYKNKFILKSELNKLLHERYEDRPLFDRLDLIAEKINNTYFQGKDKDFNGIRNRLFKLTNIKRDYKACYKALYKSVLFQRTYGKDFNLKEVLNNLSTDTMPYEDSTPFIYMKCLLEGYPYQVAMRQVVIDEAQDYTYLQYFIINKIFKNANFTILGDVNQTVNPFYKYDNLNVLTKIFKDAEYIELTKTYRSSPEIIEYANNILGLNHVSAIRRTMHLPVLKHDIKDLQHIGKDIKYLKDKYKSVAIITKSIDEAKLIYKSFKDKYKKISLLDANTKKYYTELVVTPAYSAKGLEFDACIIVNNFEKDKYLFYVAVTRAQHELIIYE